MRNYSFSIIVPVYNVENYLSECLDSLILQDYSNFEIIVVNDCSTDNSLSICKKYQAISNQVCLINLKENQGLSNARNAGILNAKNEYLIFLDSDDYIDINALSRINEFLNSCDEKLEVIATRYITKILDNTTRVRAISFSEKTMSGDDFFLMQFDNHTFYTSVWANIYSKNFIQKHSIYFKFGILHEDHEWLPRILSKALKIKIIDYGYYFYRTREGSIMTNPNISINAESRLQTYKVFMKLNPFENPKTVKIYNSFIVEQYLKAYRIGKLKHKVSMKNKIFLIRNSRTKKQLKHVIFFTISLRLYHRLIADV